MYTCKWCSNSYESYVSLAKHTSRTHKIVKEELRIAYFHNGIHPICACGCGQPTKFHASGFMQYINGHNSRVANGMTGKTHSTTAKQNISQKRKAKFASGELHMWSEGKTKETSQTIRDMAIKISQNTDRAKKISISLSGKKHTEEHRLNNNASVKKAWSDPIRREAQSHRRMLLIKERGWEIKSSLEKIVDELLQRENIGYHAQHYVRDIKALYDFYIHKSDGSYFLVEIHGDYWHCNPDTKYKFPKYDAQLKNIKNDEKKRLWCERNNIPLLIIWETDIDSALDKIKQQLNA